MATPWKQAGWMPGQGLLPKPVLSKYGLGALRPRHRAIMSAMTALPVGSAPAPWPCSMMGPTVAFHAHGVVIAANARQKVGVLHQGGLHAGLDVAVDLARLGQQLDAVAELAGELCVQARYLRYAAHRQAREREVASVGQADEHHQLVRGVEAFDVEGGVCLGVAQVLGLLEARWRSPDDWWSSRTGCSWRCRSLCR